MSATAAAPETPAVPTGPTGWFPVGRMFVHPLFDYLLIGGVLTLLTVPFLPPMDMAFGPGSGEVQLAAILLFANSCHFAASTIRLYTKKGMFQASPLHTMVLPIAFLVLIGVCIAYDQVLGRNFFYLYLTWSPFHYAAQSYGLASMYGHRSGVKLDASESRLLWVVAMLPFLYAFASAHSSGLMWFVPDEWLAVHSGVAQVRRLAIQALGALTFVMPVALYLKTRTGGRSGLPMISYAILLSNGVWWIAFQYVDAFGWATVGHSIQYLAIMLIFHARENAGEGTGAMMRATVSFYARCLVLGYALFHVLPYAYVAMGFPLASSMLVVAAAINIHHFVVDRVIWRQRKDPNLRVVVQ